MCRVFLQLVPLAVFVCIAMAQETVQYGSIAGRVTDPSVVSQRRAGDRHPFRHGPEFETATDRNGRFRFPYLKIGEYAVTVREQGFADATSRVALTAGSAFDLPVALTLEGRSANIVVTGEPAVLEAARSQISGTVPLAEARALPLNGRSSWNSRFSRRAYPPPTPGALNSLRRPPPFRGRDCPSGASETSPTTSRWTAFRRTTTRQG